METLEHELPLALAALRVSEPAAVESHVVEFHRNIGCYQALVRVREGAAPPDATRLRVRVSFPNVALVLVHGTGEAENEEEEAVWWATEVERSVDAAKCVVSVKEDHVHVRLPVKAGDRDVADDGFTAFSQVVAAELDASRYARLACRACGNALVASAFERALPLPSANWADMFDFWGSGLGAFEHLPRDAIFAQPARVFVGEAHILLHAGANVAPESLVAARSADAALASSSSSKMKDEKEEEDEDAHKRLWEPLECSQCGAALGSRHREDAQTIRLDKHTITAKAATSENHEAETDGSDIFARYTVDSVVCAKVLEFADSDGVFRFALRSSASSLLAAPVDAAAAQSGSEAEPPAPSPAPPMLLQLLSWETTVKTQHAPDFRRVLKVMYAPLQSETSSSRAAGPPSQDLVFSPAICAAVAARLESSSQLLPASLRTFNKMAVGYLFV